MAMLRIPDAPRSIQKGVPLKSVLGKEAVNQLGANLNYADSSFDSAAFTKECLLGLEPLSLKERASHIGRLMQKYLPSKYEEALKVIGLSLTEPLEKTEDNGLAPMFYMPHCSFVEEFGVDAKYNEGQDPFEASMLAMYELTQRFTCEFCIRPQIEANQERTMELLMSWMNDENAHVRRLCSEGTRPRLPWAMKLSGFVNDPKPCLPILDELKDDEDLYVRRSVANHVGDIAKDHLDLAMDLCESWLDGASKERKWVIRHAVRNPFKKGVEKAIELRKLAK